MERRLDHKGRWRNINVSFRVSQEEDAQLRTAAKLAGLNRQRYVIEKVFSGGVTVQGNPRVYKALRDQLAAVLDELRRIEAGERVNDELLETVNLIAAIMNGMKEGTE